MKQITKKDMLALEGIKLMAAQYLKIVDDLIQMTAEISGEKLDQYGGHADDFIYQGYSVKQYLSKLK